MELKRTPEQKVQLVESLLQNGIDAYIESTDTPSLKGFVDVVKAASVKRPTFEEWQRLLREPFLTQRIPGRVWAGVNLGTIVASDLRGGHVSPHSPTDIDHYFYDRELKD